MNPSPLSGLPTMQCNALRIILGKREFDPQEVAQLDYQLLVRSSRIGRKGIVCIRDWLQQFGYDIANYPSPRAAQPNLRKEQQLSKAVSVLRRNGFEVQIEALLGQPASAVKLRANGICKEGKFGSRDDAE